MDSFYYQITHSFYRVLAYNNYFQHLRSIHQTKLFIDDMWVLALRPPHMFSTCGLRSSGVKPALGSRWARGHVGDVQAVTHYVRNVRPG